MKFVRMISKVECGQKSTRLGSSSSSFQQTHCIVVCPVDRGSSLQSPQQQKSRSRPRQVLLLPNTRKWGLFFCCCAEATQVICPMKWLLLLPAGLLWHQRDHLLMDKGGNWFLSSGRQSSCCGRDAKHTSRTPEVTFIVFIEAIEGKPTHWHSKPLWSLLLAQLKVWLHTVVESNAAAR